MRRKILILVEIFALLFLFFVGCQVERFLCGRLHEQETASGKVGPVVVLDSGHGGRDPGKVGINGVLEKDINLQITKRMKKRLQKKGIFVAVTEPGQREAKAADMRARVSFINEQNPALAVSIHQNSYPDSRVQGAQVFYHSASPGGEQAANLIQKQLQKVDERNQRRIKANNAYYLLKKTQSPLVIIECGFLSNRQDAEKLSSPEYQQKLAEAICRGICAFLNRCKQSPASMSLGYRREFQ